MAFTNSDCYELDAGCFSVYGYEYATGCVFLITNITCYDTEIIRVVLQGISIGSSMIPFHGDLKPPGWAPIPQLKLGPGPSQQNPWYVIP